jgi:hypothetical protein
MYRSLVRFENKGKKISVALVCQVEESTNSKRMSYTAVRAHMLHYQ